MLDRKIASMRSQLTSSRHSTSRPGSPKLSDSKELSLSRGFNASSPPGSPLSSLESPGRRIRDWNQHSGAGGADMTAVDILVRGAVAQEIRELESSLEAKLEGRVQSAAVAKIYTMEKEVKAGIELTLRHLAATLGLMPIQLSEDGSAAGSPPAGLIKARASARASNSQAAYENSALQESLNRLVREVDVHDKDIHDLKVDTKVEIRDLQRNLEDLRQEQRSNREIDAMQRKLERLESDRKAWEVKLEQDVQHMQQEVSDKLESSLCLDDDILIAVVVAESIP
jgi:hypothetical protein